MTRPSICTVLFNLFAWSVVLAVSFPLFWMVTTALKSPGELFAVPPTILPKQVTFEFFRRLLFETPFPVYFCNSLVVALATTVVVIAVATMGAYSLVRFEYPGRRLGAQLVLFTYLLPPVVLILPLYLMMAWLRLVNSLASLVIAYTTFSLPFSLWLLRSFMASIPVDLESAALVDGASRLGAFVDVILPQALPGVISTALFTFILSWNEYLYALVLINEDARKTLPPGVTTLLTSTFNVEWSLLMAASVMMSVPVIIFFSFLQKHLTRGFGAGAVKG
jgi:multiple sugar transport system permease protein